MAPPDVMMPRQTPKKQQPPPPKVCKLESALAAHLQRLYRDQGILVVEDERRVFYYCTACSKWSFTDASLADHLQGKMHRRVMATSPAPTQSPGSPWKLQSHPPASSPTSTPLSSALSTEAGRAADKGGSKRKRPTGAAPAVGPREAKASSTGTAESGGQQEGSPGALQRNGTGGASNGHRYRSIGLPPWKRVPRCVPELGPRAASSGPMHSHEGTQAPAPLPRSSSDPTPASGQASPSATEPATASVPPTADAPVLKKQKEERQAQHTPRLMYKDSDSRDLGDGWAGANHSTTPDEVETVTCPLAAPLEDASLDVAAMEQSAMAGEPAQERASQEEIARVMASAALLAKGVGLLIMDFSADLGRGKCCAGTCAASRAGAGCTCGAPGHSDGLPSASGKGDAEKDRATQLMSASHAEAGLKAQQAGGLAGGAGTPADKACVRAHEAGASAADAGTKAGGGSSAVAGEVRGEGPTEESTRVEETSGSNEQRAKGAARTRDRPEEQRLAKRGKKGSKGGKGVHGSKGLERQCFFCGQLMREGEKVAALWNVETQQPACSSRNDHGKFHIFHVDCIWDWVLFSASSIAKQQLQQPSLLPSLPAQQTIKAAPQALSSSDAPLCPTVAGPGGAASGFPLLQPPVLPSEKGDSDKTTVCESSRALDGEDQQGEALGKAEAQSGAGDSEASGSKGPADVKVDGEVQAEGQAAPDTSPSMGVSIDVESGGPPPLPAHESPAALQAPGQTDEGEAKKQLSNEAGVGEGDSSSGLQLGALPDSPRSPAPLKEVCCPECQGTGRRGAGRALEHPRYRLSQVYDWILSVLLARNPAVPAADLSVLSAPATNGAAEESSKDLLAHSLLRVRLEFPDALTQQAVCEASQHVKLLLH